MFIKDYLKEKQPIVYKTFLNALNNDKLSHAYLIIGDVGTPLKETALFFAKSLVCQNPSPLACELCSTCKRIDENKYADLLIYDGEVDTIKKENVDLITSRFSKTAVESKGRVIYILHLVENMTIQAINSLLKFLEEPGKETYAILTTHNESRVLPTIVSRSQKVELHLENRNEVISNAIKIGLNKEDVELLSYFYSNVETIKNKINDEEYLLFKKLLFKFIECINNQADLIFFIEHDLSSHIKEKESARFFMDLLSEVLEDVIRKNNQEKLFLDSYDKIITELALKMKHVEASLLELITLRTRLDLNISPVGAFEHLAIYMNKE